MSTTPAAFVNYKVVTGPIQPFIDSGALAGAATLIWRGGEVHISTHGVRDLQTKLPVERGTIFRIASMSKPITSTAALMLLEEGRFTLDDPITRWAPEFSQMRVLRGQKAPLQQTDPAHRPITFDDLLTHRSGLTYGGFHTGFIAKAYSEALGGDIDTHLTADEWIARLAALPLIDQPGAGFHYGHSTDLLGLILERIENASLGDILKRRIFTPLGMEDTGFVVPPGKRARCAAPCGFNDDGRLIARSDGPGRSFLAERPAGMTYVSGGQGLWSTLDDYLAFALMFLGEGAVDGVRLLRPETLALMTSNRLTQPQLSSARWILDAGHGFGLGVAVVVDPEKAGPKPCGGSLGSIGWPGGFGGWWRADPRNNSVLIFLSHNMVELDQLLQGIGAGVFSAIAQFAMSAAAAPGGKPA